MKNVLACFLFLLVAGTSYLQLDTPVQAMEVLEMKGEATVQEAETSGIEEKDWTLQYKLKEKDLYIECVVPEFSLSKKEKDGDGYLLVRMNGQVAAKMNQAAFMIKDLPPGEHSIEVSPVDYNGEALDETITFEVEVPNL